MKIRTQKQLNFQELINFIYKNNIKYGTYLPDGDTDVNTVWVGNYDIEFDDNSCITKDDTWTVEEEVEITKETELPVVLIGHGNSFITYYDLSIQEAVKRFKNIGYTIKTIHLINDDSTHTLIYKDGELVE